MKRTRRRRRFVAPSMFVGSLYPAKRWVLGQRAVLPLSLDRMHPVWWRESLAVVEAGP